MRYLYISDMDGTLLNSKGRVSAKSQKILSRLMDEGMQFTLATGRTPLSAIPLTAELPMKLPLILLNGSLIMSVDGEICHKTAFDVSELEYIASLEEKHVIASLQIGVLDDKLAFSSPKHGGWDAFFEKNKAADAAEKSLLQPVCKTKGAELLYLFYMDNKPEQLQHIASVLEKDGRFVLDYYKDIYLENTWFLEVYSKRASKGLAVNKLREMLAVDKVICFGDSTNDLPLFSACDYKLAMGNAREQIKAAADEIIGSNDEDGVACWLHKHWQEKKMRVFNCPEPSQSIAALASSLLKHFDCDCKNPSLAQADMVLERAPRNVVMLVLDGLGSNILEKHLPTSSFLMSHRVQNISSVFPPTTAAAATALETALFPSQCGWLGWTIYWPPIDKNISIYLNTDENGEQAAAEHIGKTYLSIQNLTDTIRIKTQVPSYSICEQGDIYANNLEDVLENIKKICNEPGKHFIYGYVNEPDHTLHYKGCDSDKVTKWLLKADKQLSELQESCSDTLFFLTADHGFIDVEPMCLEDYPELEACLVRKPSVEPRALNLFVKEEKHEDFLRIWKGHMGDSYRLFSREEALKIGLFGPTPIHEKLPEMLGDYIAVATGSKTLFPNPSYLQFMRATHGGMTAQELTVPLIIW